MDATTVAVDVAKTVFEIAIANRQGHIIARHRFNRRQFARFLATTPATHVVMEACGTAHFWGRCAHQHGHAVSLLPPAYVRPYVRRNKTDRTDAEALLEAMRSGQLPVVPVKSVAQQTVVALHRLRDQWMSTRTARINTVRGILREQGVLLPAGAGPAVRAIPGIVDDAAVPIADALRRMISLMCDEVREVERHIAAGAPCSGRRRPGRHSTARHTRHRAADSHRAGGHRGAYPGIWSRSTVCELAGADATRVFERNASAARRDQ